jgi:hypothetical protein
MITFNFDLTTIAVDFLSVQTGTNQTKFESREAFESREVFESREAFERKEQVETVEESCPQNQGFFICRFPSFAQKCVTQKYEFSRILTKLSAKIRFFTRMITSHLKKV